jgi:hypothetical protein
LSNIPSRDSLSARESILQKNLAPANQLAEMETIKVLPSIPKLKTAHEAVTSEGLSDILSEMTDEELLQIAAMYKTDPFNEETVQ